MENRDFRWQVHAFVLLEYLMVVKNLNEDMILLWKTDFSMRSMGIFLEAGGHI